jgi:hypothetical protein
VGSEVRRRLGIVMAVGIACGIAIPLGVLGVGVTHTECSSGPIIGWSGPLLTPWDVALAPPGGYVNSSYELTSVSSNFSVQTGGGSTIPKNATTSDFEVDNWTMNSESSNQIPGWGAAVSCPPYILEEGYDTSGVTGISGCDGCQIVPSAPEGIGQRLLVPEEFYFNSTPSTVINASYNAPPIATFSFHQVPGGIQFSSPGNFSDLPFTDGPFYEFGQLYGFELTVVLSTIQFGVPIHFTNGTSETVPGAIPTDLTRIQSSESISFSIHMTYVFPFATAQGTWNVYAAGAGSPYSIGGLLFEQTATQT